MRDFPSPLVEGSPSVPPWRPKILLLLVLLCLAPRAWQAYHWDILWGDTVAYLRASEALEKGDLDRAFLEFGLNIYPVILTGLRHLGLDWETTGKWWSVLMATATVVPLWGWIRRQFDDRIAVAACICYALHGKLVAISPLIIRDPTFWFLFASTLYAMWRAVVEIRLRWFLAAGVALTLAVHIRTEGWLLAIPLIGWSAGRWQAAAGSRRRLAAGAALCLAVIFLPAVIVNATLLRGHPRWELVRSQHVRIIWDWWRGAAPAQGPAPGNNGDAASRGETASSSETGKHKLAASPFQPARSSRRAFDSKLVSRLLRGFTYSGGLLTLVGLTSGWRIFFRREHITLLVLNLFLIATIQIRSGQEGIDLRYFMPMVCTALPWMALGYFQLVDWMASPMRRCDVWTPGRQKILAGVLAVMAATASMAEAGLPAAAIMHRNAVLGRWIFDRLGPQQLITGNFGGAGLVTYYAQGDYAGVFDRRHNGDEDVPPVVTSRQADLIVLAWDAADRRDYIAWVESQLTSQWGYWHVPREQLPEECEPFDVFVRSDKAW